MKPVAMLPLHVDQAGEGPPTLIDRYVARDDRALQLVFDTDWLPFALSLRLVDTTHHPAALRAGPDEAAIWHVLWVRDEAGGAITVSSPAGDGSWAIAPGDSVAVPPGGSLRAPGGQLAVAITVPDADTRLSPPTHGTERYFGYNRLTDAFELGGIRLCRWKLTQPLDLVRHHPTPLVVMALARTSVIRTASTIVQLAQGQAALIEPAAEPIVNPDGLAYLLTVERI